MEVRLAPDGFDIPDGRDRNGRRLREVRNRMLTESDWTQTVDAPLSDEEQAEWATYRQALRDLPTTAGQPTPCVVMFPDPPR